METTITRKGQVTIPKHIRDSLRLAPGSKLVFDVNAAGSAQKRTSKTASSRPFRPRFGCRGNQAGLLHRRIHGDDPGVR
jgi:AbrB family looped-hinge helix DNA binding protein